MARSKTQMTHAKRAREIARLEKRTRKQEKKEARKLAASYPSPETELASDAPPETEPGEQASTS